MKQTKNKKMSYEEFVKKFKQNYKEPYKRFLRKHWVQKQETVEEEIKVNCFSLRSTFACTTLVVVRSSCQKSVVEA